MKYPVLSGEGRSLNKKKRRPFIIDELVSVIVALSVTSHLVSASIRNQKPKEQVVLEGFHSSVSFVFAM